MNISIRHLQHFISVAEELHFRRAAQISNVAQPALSRSVQTLETELGVQLLNRNNRNVKLTAAGQEFYAGATTIVDAMQNTIDQAIRAERLQFGGVNIGYTFIGMVGKLPELIANFEKKNPDIHVHPSGGTTEDQLVRMRREEIDCCFMSAPVDDTLSADIESVPFQTDAFVVIVSHNHPLAKHGVISVEQLAGEKIILSGLPVDSAFNRHVRQFLNHAGVEPNIEYSEQNHIGILGLTALERGIAIATEGYGCVYGQELCILKLAGVEARLPMLMAWRKDACKGPVIKFRDFILQNLATSPASVSKQSEPAIELE